MELLSIYPSPAENVFIWGAVLFFTVFLLTALGARLAAGSDPYTRLNRAHSLLFIPYLCAALIFAYKSGELSPALLPALIVGCFVYFGLHYVYFFALVGLVKKSISVNLLCDIDAMAAGKEVPVPDTAFLAHEKAKLDLIRRDRLDQMVTLGMAFRNAGIYTITRKGRLGNFAGGLVLRIWNLKRI